MSRKDYIKIARLFAEQRDPVTGHTPQGWLQLRDGMADILAEGNPNFDRQRFIAATEKE